MESKNKNELDQSILKRSYIKKEDLTKQVWRIYNITVPRTAYQAEKEDGTLDEYILEKLIEDNTGDMESEEASRDRFDKFRDLSNKCLEKILKEIKTPLIKYISPENTPLMPVIVGATFAAIIDMTKYKFMSPQKILEKEPELLLSPVRGTKDPYDETNYFIMRIIENLKYFYNIAPEPEETNLNRSLTFDYSIYENDGIIIINATENDLYKRAEIDNDIVIKEIGKFKNNYIAGMKNQEARKWKARFLIYQVDNLLKVYSDSRVSDLKMYLRRCVFDTYGLNDKKRKELDFVFPLDFTEPEYNKCHDILSEIQKNDFYKELRGKVRSIGEEVESKNNFEVDFFDDEKLTVREAELVGEIKNKIGELSEQIYKRSKKEIKKVKI